MLTPEPLLRRCDMTQATSIQMRQPWTLLHEPEAPKRKLDPQSEAERATAARRIDATLNRARDRAMVEFTLCSRPYF
jgi:hypothetical protein